MPKKQKHGILIASIGLLLGVLCGALIVMARNYARDALVEVLSDEIEQSCDCKLVFDDVKLSLLRLRAVATNARVLHRDEDRLSFNRIIAKFSLAGLLNKKIYLTSLELIGGFAKGVTENSPAFRIIDHLAAPPTKESTGIKLKLLGLTLSDSSFLEPLNTSSIVGSEVSLNMQRTHNDDWQLYPQIGRLTFQGSKNRLELGSVAGSVIIRDRFIDFSNLVLKQTDNLFVANGRDFPKEHNRLQGKTNLTVDASSFDLPGWLKFALKGQGKIEGTINQPLLSGGLSKTKEYDSGIHFPESSELNLDRLNLKYRLWREPDGLAASIDSLSGTSSNLDLQLKQQVFVKPSGLSGSLKVRISNASFYNLSVSDVEGEVHFGGTQEEPVYRLDLRAKKLGLPVGTTDNVRIEADLSGHSIDGKLHFSNSALLPLEVHLTRNRDNWIVSDSKFEISNLELYRAKERTHPSLLFSLSGKFSGPIDPRKLSGSLEWHLSQPKEMGNLLVEGEGNLRDGNLNASIRSDDQTISGSIALDFNKSKEPGKIAVELKDFPLESYFPDVECGKISLSLAYSFLPTSLLLGNGSLNLNRISVGCGSAEIVIKERKLAVDKGLIQVKQLKLINPYSTLVLNGTLSLVKGWDLELAGELLLDSLLGLVGIFDDMRGRIAVVGNLKGPIFNPDIDGSVVLNDALLTLERASVIMDRVSGKLFFKGKNIEVHEVSGKLNGGSFEINGHALPLHLARSNLQARFEKVNYYPLDNLGLSFSGYLNLNDLENKIEGLSGQVEIESADFQRQIDLQSIVRSVARKVFLSSRAKASSSELPDIPVNLQIHARRNMFVLTSWLAAELRGQVRILNTLSDPLLSGYLETLSGWFGLRDKRFDITSGRLSIKPTDTEPTIDLVSEAYFPSPTGENVLVILEARGSVSNPTISLSSDRGDTPNEVLKLITTGSNLSSQGLLNDLLSESSVALVGEESKDRGLLDRLFHGITRLDSLNIEPTFNLETGTIEPAVVATKKLLEQVSVSGKTFIGSTSNSSSLSVDLKATPKLLLSTGIETTADRQTAAFAGDLTYTVLASDTAFVEFSIRGNETYSKDEILRALRVSNQSRLQPQDSKNLAATLSDFLSLDGFPNVQVAVSCDADPTYCSRIYIDIQEGSPELIDQIDIVGVKDFSVLPKFNKPTLERPVRAQKQFSDELMGTLIKQLRSEGFIAARANYELSSSITTPHKTLTIFVDTGKPVSFVFKGNRLFSAEDFLESINLFNRKIPFGNNTINILAQNIERMYRQAGRLYVEVKYVGREDPESGRLIYDVEIKEGPKVAVDRIDLNLGSGISESELRNLVRQYFPDRYDGIFKPDYAISEVLDLNDETIASIYIEQGFPKVKVKHLIEPHGDNEVIIRYIITEGQEVKSDWLELPELAARIQMPPKPKAPYSIPKANRFMDAVLERLKDIGYLQAEIWSELNPDSGKLTIRVIEGKPTNIGKIIFEGNKTISSEEIHNHLSIKPGDIWEQKKINLSRRNLLRLGLFSRVELSPADGALDNLTEDLKVRVSERSLRTLEVGSGLNSEYGLHFFGEAIDKAVFHDGRSFSLRLDTYYDDTSAAISRGIASLRYLDPFVLDSDIRFSEELRFQKIERSTYEFDLDRISANTTFTKPWTESLSTSMGYTILQENLTKVPVDTILSDLDTGIVDLGLLTGVLTYDGRDNPLFPKHGNLFAIDYKIASYIIGSDADFYSLSGRASFIRPVPYSDHRLIFANASRLGSAWTYGTTSNIPISQRFYLGGRNTVRGFRENSLGPRGITGSVIGGDLLVANSTELRYLVNDWLSIQSFLDLGTVYLKDNSTNLGDIRRSIGMGLSYLSPIGPIGLDLGHPLDEKSGEPSVRVHFSIGSNF